MIEHTVVIVKGSRSDRTFCNELGAYLTNNGIRVIHRTASAHRTPEHLERIVKEYDRVQEISAFITVAGLSDALSGSVAAKTAKPVIAFPPDLTKYGDSKIFSTTKLPSGLKVTLASSRKEVLKLIRESPKSYYSENELKERRLKTAETYFTDNQDIGLTVPLGIPLYKKGKVRDVYDLGDRLLINSTDRISAFDVNSITEIEGKGASLNLLSAWWFRRTKKIFPNHFIDVPDVTMTLANKADRVDIEWVVRSHLYGSVYREYARGERLLYGYRLRSGLRLAEELDELMITPTTKADVGHDLPIDKERAIDMGLVNCQEWEVLSEASLRLYDFYASTAKHKGLLIPDFKIEFGRYKGDLIQIDEAPNHDSARIWVRERWINNIGKRQEAWCLDKEFYRQFLIDSGIDPGNPPNPLPEIPEPVIFEIRKRLEGVYMVFVQGLSVSSLHLRSLEDVERELGVGRKDGLS
ncbi:MAG: phosphoribosylaminoimidazolesuccinocarboxamide synthase [Nitrososphaeria archaeon]